jgi:GxxExxY protein
MFGTRAGDTTHSYLALNYKGAPLKQTYKPDFICFEKIILELKAVREIAPEHYGHGDC